MYGEGSTPEIVRLRSEDVNENNILHIRGTKTAAADRYIHLSAHMQAVLAEQRKMLKESGIISPYIFPNKRGEITSPNNVYNNWSIYRKQHRITSSLHELRHTFISLSKAEVPEELLKQVVGHTDKTDTFGIYGHLVDGDLQRVSNIMDGIFDKILSPK